MTRPSHASELTPRSSVGFPGVAEGDPAVFLDAFRGEPRGFWGRGERWVAWGGELARIEVPLGRGGSRFQAVRDEARHALGRLPNQMADLSPWENPRFFGGFSFVDSASPGPEWRGFPAASFILPRVTLACRDGELRFSAAESTPGWVNVASSVKVASSVRAEGSTSEPTETQSRCGADEEAGADRLRWSRAARTVLTAIGRGSLQKAVLARVLDVHFDESVDPLAALRFLRSDNERAHVFLFEPTPGRVFLGAAPEILAQLRDGYFEATAVAGSMPRAMERTEDEALALQLLQSEKDLAEHRLTVEEMIEVLEARLVGMEVDPGPRILRLAGIQHLETIIRGSAAPGEDILSLVEAVHPTPAVCGRPRAEAFVLLGREELFDRGWYSGPVGWFDARGEGDFVPALRCAVGAGRSWRLFAGAGIVSGSDPDAEWKETELKLEPALRALRAAAGIVP